MNASFRSRSRLLAIGFTLLIPLAASASPVTINDPLPTFPSPVVRGLTGTGMAAPGVPFVVGSIDTHWSSGYRSTLGSLPSNMTYATSVVATPLPSGWVGNTGRSQWIQPLGLNRGPGYYYYQATFDLSDQDLASFQLRFRMTGDDAIERVMLNDWVTPYAADGTPGDPLHGHWSELLSIDNDDRPGLTPSFHQGLNTLTFMVHNIDGDNTGLQVQFVPQPRSQLVAAVTPEPMTLAVFGAVSVAGLVGARRRRSRAA